MYRIQITCWNSVGIGECIVHKMGLIECTCTGRGRMEFKNFGKWAWPFHGPVDITYLEYYYWSTHVISIYNYVQYKKFTYIHSKVPISIKLNNHKSNILKCKYVSLPLFENTKKLLELAHKKLMLAAHNRTTIQHINWMPSYIYIYICAEFI